MATYKVIQDVEADDKLVGPLSLRQFIYAGIAALCGYLSFLAVSKHAGFMLVVFLPIMLVSGFFAFPWGKDQPTEIWALAKIRFLMKPRRRIWDQSGAKDLVSITAPKQVDRPLTDGLNRDEVQSRLEALANTIDSRGWAIKDVNVNLGSGTALVDSSDRLVTASSLPREVSTVDVRAADDMLDERANPIAQQFDAMIQASDAAHRQQLMSQLQQPGSTPAAQPPANYWFLHQPGQARPGQATFTDAAVVAPGSADAVTAEPHAATPTAEEEAMVAKFKAENSSQTPAYNRLKHIKTPKQLAEEARAAAAAAAKTQAQKAQVTPEKQAAIMKFANDNDKDVATLARMADDEVVISLH